jgi:hypothetical protein
MRFKSSTMKSCGTWSFQRPQMSWKKRWCDTRHGNPITLTMRDVVRRPKLWLSKVEYIAFLFYFLAMYLFGMYSKFSSMYSSSHDLKHLYYYHYIVHSNPLLHAPNYASVLEFSKYS